MASTSRVAVGPRGLPGDLALASCDDALILLLHDDSRSRCDGGNRFIADVLQAHGMGTLSLSLATPDEEQAQADVPAGECAIRLVDALAWTRRRHAGGGRAVGLLSLLRRGGSCLSVAARRDAGVKALVVYEGDVDPLANSLSRVQVPTLFITKAPDVRHFADTRAAMRAMAAPTRLELLPDEGSCGTRESIARLATQWFVKQLRGAPRDGEHRSLGSGLPLGIRAAAL